MFGAQLPKPYTLDPFWELGFWVINFGLSFWVQDSGWFKALGLGLRILHRMCFQTQLLCTGKQPEMLQQRTRLVRKSENVPEPQPKTPNPEPLAHKPGWDMKSSMGLDLLLYSGVSLLPL